MVCVCCVPLRKKGVFFLVRVLKLLCGEKMLEILMLETSKP